jgi:hypothetical protein
MCMRMCSLGVGYVVFLDTKNLVVPLNFVLVRNQEFCIIARKFG